MLKCLGRYTFTPSGTPSLPQVHTRRWAAPAAIEPAAFYGCCVLGPAKLSCLAPYYKQDRTSLGPGMALGHAVLEMLGTIVLLVTGTAVYDRCI